MIKSKKNIAVVLAAGRGERSGFDKPKQLMKLAGKPVVEHVMTTFQQNHQIDEILVVASVDCVDGIEEILLEGNFSKVRGVILGGKERHESSLAAIKATKNDCKNHDVRLVFHDAVRPLVSQKIINDVLDALNNYRAVDVVIRTTDTIIEAAPLSNTILHVPKRENLRNGQTPQAFHHEVIETAYELALCDPAFVTTDDCGVVLKYLPHEPVYLVEGAIDNMKLTYMKDLHILDRLCQLQSSQMNEPENSQFVLNGLRGKVLVVFGGTSGIGKDIANLAAAYNARVLATGRRSGVNISRLEDVKSALEDTASRYGKVDMVINSAGVLNKQPLVDMNETDILDGIQTNYLGAVNVARASFPHLRESRGMLLNFTSSSYTYGRAFYSIYSSSKAAVVNLTQALADEWHTHQIKVNCINPQRTASPMRTKAFGNEPKESLLESKDVARRSLLVACSELTGQVVDIRL
jgi:2-C-methyl-D-erythritol 4-phosphate cytidylyltransferase